VQGGGGIGRWGVSVLLVDCSSLFEEIRTVCGPDGGLLVREKEDELFPAGLLCDCSSLFEEIRTVCGPDGGLPVRGEEDGLSCTGLRGVAKI
jgi:hypothetical protein